jgi:hypothetical protein
MAIHSDGGLTATQEDSATHDQQADGYPYIVFGYGSLIFRVRFPELCMLSPLGANRTDEIVDFSLMDGRTDVCVVAPTSRCQKEYAHNSFFFSRFFSLLSARHRKRHRGARSPGPAPIDTSHRVTSHRGTPSLLAFL